MNPPTSGDPALAPTQKRYGVLGFCCVLSMITYLDRVCMGTVMPSIQREFGFNDEQVGWIFAAFTLAYSVFEVPTGWLGDRFGPRITLVRIVLWWSVFTVLTATIYPTESRFRLFGNDVATAFLLLMLVRFLFGIGEAGAYPNISCAFRNWFPVHERGFAKGAVWMAGRFAGGITGFIVLALLYDTAHPSGSGTITHWRHVFWLFGGLGVVWCVAFWFWFRDRPEQMPSVNAAELAIIRSGAGAATHEKLEVPWRKLFTNVNLWLLCAMYFCASFGWYFNITYLPGFLEKQFGLSKGDKWTAGWWSFSAMQGMPLLLGSVACLVGGLLTDRFIKATGNRKWGRRLFGILGHGLCAVFFFVALAIIWLNPQRETRTLGLAWLFVGSVAFATFWNDMTMGSAWASCIDIGGRYAGIVSGCMNTIGNLGGFVANILTGKVLQSWLGSVGPNDPNYYDLSQPAWLVNFSLFGAAYVVAVLLWSRFDATKPVAPEAAK